MGTQNPNLIIKALYYGFSVSSELRKSSGCEAFGWTVGRKFDLGLTSYQHYFLGVTSIITVCDTLGLRNPKITNVFCRFGLPTSFFPLNPKPYTLNPQP